MQKPLHDLPWLKRMQREGHAVILSSPQGSEDNVPSYKGCEEEAIGLTGWYRLATGHALAKLEERPAHSCFASWKSKEIARENRVFRALKTVPRRACSPKQCYA